MAASAVLKGLNMTFLSECSLAKLKIPETFVGASL